MAAVYSDEPTSFRQYAAPFSYYKYHVFIKNHAPNPQAQHLKVVFMRIFTAVAVIFVAFTTSVAGDSNDLQCLGGWDACCIYDNCYPCCSNICISVLGIGVSKYMIIMLHFCRSPGSSLMWSFVLDYIHSMKAWNYPPGHQKLMRTFFRQMPMTQCGNILADAPEYGP